MKLRIAAVVVAFGAFGVGASLAGAEPADESPIDGHRAHPHHIHTGDGECKDLDQNLFEPAQEGERRHRGLHNGAVQSGRVHHGTCASHQS